MTCLSAVSRARFAALLAMAFTVLACDGVDQCYPGECDPCVGETCALECEDPDDEDIGYSCSLSCSEGADCEVGCIGVSCLVSCDASRCAGESWDHVDCTNDAECSGSAYSVFCSQSRCDVDGPFGRSSQTCIDGSRCDATCGSTRDDEARCAMSCDETSSCRLACEGACLLCCNGSSDCAIDCPSGGATCEGGMLACGLACPAADEPAGCPALQSAREP